MQSKRTPNPVFRPAFVCGAVLLLATLALAQHALDANLRVGSGGRNAHRAPQVTMTRSPYSVGRNGTMVYNRAVAFNDSTYRRPMTRHQRSIGNIDPKPLGRSRASATALARPSYSVTASAKAFSSPSRVRSVNRAPGSATLQRSGYSPNRRVSAMQTPSFSLSKQAYSLSGRASQPVRSR